MENHPNKQANSDDCFVCGRNNPKGLYMSFFDNGVDEVISYYTVEEAFQSYPGVVHGGIITSMLDEVVARVSFIGDPHKFMMSVKLEVKFRKPVPVGEPLVIKGRIIKLKGRLGQAVGEVVLSDGTVAAESSMTLADMPKDLASESRLHALGWRVDK
jgi:uncharacterized protein (TIGR00369 family)